MPKTSRIEKKPLGALGKRMFALVFFELVLLWVISIFAAGYLVGTIATHYGLSGTPDAYGTSNVFFVLAGAFSIAPIIILVLTYFRYNLINDYPYMINMPAFYTNLANIPEKRRAYWINRYFELMLVVAVYITAVFIIMAITLFFSSQTGYANPLFISGLPIAAIVLMIVLLFFILRGMYKQISKESRR